MLSIGKRIAQTAPITVTITAVHFSDAFAQIVLKEIEALQASRKVVVTVERMITTRAAFPRPALSMICAMSLSFVRIAAPIPIMYIQQDTTQ